MKDKIVNDKSYLASTFNENCLLLMYFIYDILLTIESRVGVVMLKDSNLLGCSLQNLPLFYTIL